jgi:class 3 adenylate cyclase/predicted ATPase
MLTWLAHYLPRELYDPLERRPKERHFIAVRDHLAALIRTVKTYLPLPVYRDPQPAGVPQGGMVQGVFLFGDVSGFTPLSESLKRQEGGAERVAEIINELFSELVRELFDHGGTLLKFGGDALLGLFPAQSDAEMAQGALRAAQAATAMLRVMEQEQFAAIEAGGETRALKIKCGISAGPYFAAHIGVPPSDVDYNGTMAYVTTGHTVNLAEQAEGHANPGEAALTRAAYALIADEIEVGPVTKEPDEDFVRLRLVPDREVDAGARPEVIEPPEGEVMAQITYLVERLSLLLPYLSDELVDRLKDNPGAPRIVPEYRPVTVMFANYKGISALIDKLGESDPDIITQRLNDYFGHMAEIVTGYEGTLARMDQYAVGDRLVIFFGAPKAHEDDPVRAVYTARKMQQAVHDHFAALRSSVGVFRFEQRIGINTGYLFAGNAGAPALRQEYTLMGDDINTAARLMSYAPWGSIYISDKTAEHVRAHFQLSDRFDLKVKGKQIVIPTYEVRGLREEVGQTRGLEGVVASLIGRDPELEILQDCGLSLLGKRGQIVSIIGDSGLGKSRLTREFKAWLLEQEGAEDLLWLEAQALSFSEQMGYWLAAQVLRGALSASAEASEDDILFALWEKGEALLGEDAMDAVPFLAQLMGLKLGEEWAWVEELDPKMRQKQTFWAVGEFFARLARRRPVVIALDDLHWADEASLNLFTDLLSVSDRAPVMFMLLMRARRDKGCWDLHTAASSDYPHRHTTLMLDPLTQEESVDMLHNLLPGATFGQATLDKVLDKAAGNPFYLEEVVRAMVESGAVVQEKQGELDKLTDMIKSKAKKPVETTVRRWHVTDKIHDITVPDSLQSAIIARIDRLTEDGRQALQKAAVIGRQFQLDVLRNLLQTEAEIDSWLAQLERGGLVRPQRSTDMDYAFPDALVHEVAYNSLLVNSRKAFHRQIGETLEKVYAGRLEQNCDLLAYHFSRSDDQERAITYLEMAAQKAKRAYASATAIQHYQDLLDLHRERGDPAGQADALYQMGVIAYEVGEYEDAKGWLGQAIDLYQEVDDKANLGWSVMYAGMVDLKRANYDEAVKQHARALSLAESRGDTFQAGIHMTNAARVLLRMGAYDRALQLFHKSLEQKQQNDDITGQAFAYYYIALIHIYQEQYERAEDALLASIEMWNRVEKKERGLSYCYHGLGLLALGRDENAEAEVYFQKALDISRKLVLRAEIIENLSFLGQAYLRQGKLDEAAEVSGQAISLLSSQKDVEEVQRIYLNHFRVLYELNPSEARASLERAYDEMMSQARRLADEHERETFLRQVKVNQQIQALMVQRSP